MTKKLLQDKIEFIYEKNKKLNLFSPTFIIAEVGINHEGDFSLAHDLVDKAFKAGADAVKFQIVNPEHSYSKNTKSYKVYKSSQLSENDYKLIINKFKDKGLIFATAGDISSLELCKKLKFGVYKVSSGLLTNIPLIENIIKIKKPIILSTGMATIEEIDKIVKIIKKKNKISVLHTISTYPTSILKTNLYSIKFLQKRYNLISGYAI